MSASGLRASGPHRLQALRPSGQVQQGAVQPGHRLPGEQGHGEAVSPGLQVIPEPGHLRQPAGQVTTEVAYHPAHRGRRARQVGRGPGQKLNRQAPGLRRLSSPVCI
jgi:hypothetical protein